MTPYESHNEYPDPGPGWADPADSSVEHSIAEHGPGQYHDLEAPHYEHEHYLDCDHFGAQPAGKGRVPSPAGAGCALVLTLALAGSLPVLRASSLDHSPLSWGGGR